MPSIRSAMICLLMLLFLLQGTTAATCMGCMPGTGSANWPEATMHHHDALEGHHAHNGDHADHHTSGKCCVFGACCQFAVLTATLAMVPSLVSRISHHTTSAYLPEISIATLERPPRLFVV